MERNQALAALMELEKNHTQALTTIERLKEDQPTEGSEAEPANGKSSRDSAQQPGPAESRGATASLGNAWHKNSSLGHLLRNFGQCCEQCSKKEKSYERIKYERDQIWKDIVTQAQYERDDALRRLGIVKQERDCNLERLHALEKENQRLRDAVNAGCTEGRSFRTGAEFNSSLHVKVWHWTEICSVAGSWGYL